MRPFQRALSPSPTSRKPPNNPPKEMGWRIRLVNLLCGPGMDVNWGSSGSPTPGGTCPPPLLSSGMQKHPILPDRDSDSGLSSVCKRSVVDITSVAASWLRPPTSRLYTRYTHGMAGRAGGIESSGNKVASCLGRRLQRPLRCGFVACISGKLHAVPSIAQARTFTQMVAAADRSQFSSRFRAVPSVAAVVPSTGVVVFGQVGETEREPCMCAC